MRKVRSLGQGTAKDTMVVGKEEGVTMMRNWNLIARMKMNVRIYLQGSGVLDWLDEGDRGKVRDIGGKLRRYTYPLEVVRKVWDCEAM